MTYSLKTPGGSTAAVDVLAADGTPLFEDVPSGVELHPGLDAYRHPAIRLRARLACDPADPATRPELVTWRVDWTASPERLVLKRRQFRPATGETVAGLVAVEVGGRVRVRVFDLSRRLVAVVLDGSVPARATSFTWNGRDRDGKPVAPGVYLITAAVPKGVGTRKVTVLP